MSIQTLSSCPPPSDTGSPYDSSLESLDNPIQTPKSPSTPKGQQGLVVYPPNP